MAVSLAYLALDRFRYRRDVEEQAGKLHGKYENDARLKAEKTIEVLNELRWLGRKPCNGHTPSGFFANIYRFIYRTHADVFIVMFLASISAVALATGVALNIARWGGLSWMQQPFWVGVFFYGCLLAVAFPGLSVLLGRRCKSWGIIRARSCDDQVATIIQTAARQAEVPSLASVIDIPSDEEFKRRRAVALEAVRRQRERDKRS